MTAPLRVACFDLDGTLLRHTTVSVFLAQAYGRAAALDELEQRFREGRISNAVIADASAGWFTGLRRDDVWEHLRSAPWISGIATTLARLRAQRFHVILGTITWRFAAELLQRRYRFDAVSGTEMPCVDGILTGVVSRYFDEHDKVRFVETFCEERGVGLSECVAIGDSRSDIPLFGRVGLAIALNATAEARAAAHVSVDGDDLSIVLEPIARHTPVRPAL